jgi:hypothetical protein
LNGARTREEHPAVPQSTAELAVDATAVRDAGAFAVHLHPRDAHGAQTVDSAVCDAAVAAIRVAVPGLPVGLYLGGDRSRPVRARRRGEVMETTIGEHWGMVAASSVLLSPRRPIARHVSERIAPVCSRSCCCCASFNGVVRTPAEDASPFR